MTVISIFINDLFFLGDEVTTSKSSTVTHITTTETEVSYTDYGKFVTPFVDL